MEKFIGDAVMAVFGLRTLHEDERCGRCGPPLEMRAALAR